ncbi:MAG: hypothetical protein J0I07_17665, partial [Myxococcales bacterium]|nr:hypothetical protein [Myxococcales bacterium]
MVEGVQALTLAHGKALAVAGLSRICPGSEGGTGMVKKAFAIASIAALTGMVVAIAAAGCASNDGVTPVEDGGSEPDVRTPPPNPDGDDDDDDDGGDGKCYDEKPLDVSAEKYQPPRTKPGACKENVLEVIDDLIASKQSATFDELKAAIV